jgi:exonuclease III
MRIVSWNIRAGGGVRVPGIARQIQQWRADVVALSEFRGTDASRELARELAIRSGLTCQRVTTSHTAPATNALLIASRWPLRVVQHAARPDNPLRWLQVRVAAPKPFSLVAIHVPNRVTGTKYPFLDAVQDVAARWGRRHDGLIVGDTNSGRIDIDEENPAFNEREDRWLQSMEQIGWADGFRYLRGNRREYTWYSPNGRNGFRLDQAFINPTLLARLHRVRHVWAGATRERLETLSDHASLVVDFHD